MSKLLNIYDADDSLMRKTARARTLPDGRGEVPQIHSVGVEGGMAGLCPALDRLVAQRLTFDRCVFTTHGNKGMIFFADDYVSVVRLGRLAGRGYERIFPTFSRIYFAGCNVAESDAGWAFLRKAGEIFLRLGGGYVFAHDSQGYSLSTPSFPILGGPLSAAFARGKFIHWPWDEVRGYIISPGGHVLQRVVD